MRRRETITKKHAQTLHTEIRLRDETIAKQIRELQHERDALHEEKVRAAALQIELDGLVSKVDKMGEDLGGAKMREITAKHVADVALNSMEVLAKGAQPRIASTLLSLARDGRQQLREATNGGRA